VTKQTAPAVATSVLVHIAAFGLAIFLARPSPHHEAPITTPPCAPGDAKCTQLVWINETGPGGGGGGGGNQKPDPPRQAKRPGHDATTIPVADSRTSNPAEPMPREVEPKQGPIIPVLSQASSLESMPGSITAPQGPPTDSLGPGKDGGAGTGRGPGDGPGDGSGLGPGRVAGNGDGPFRPGADILPPVEIRRGTPQYTIDAMRARVQGSFLVECVVQTSGVCTDIHIVRALTPSFGLDDEAVKAVRQWRFRPGTRRGQPVPVLVTMQIDFAIR
jgi:protein TonB